VTIRPSAAQATCCLVGLALASAVAQAQPADPRDPAAEDTGETLWDPELDGPTPGPEAPRPPPPAAPASTSTELRGFLATRIGVDTDWTTPGEEVFEATQVAQLELLHHPSETLGVGLGLRARHIVGLRRYADEGGGRERTGLDVVPVAGFVDTVLGDAGHLRTGYQIVELGRFDLFSASNFLAVHDLRSGPVTIPGASQVAQPAVRADVDPVDDLTLTAVYVPFFTPHLIDLVGSDYSLGGALQSAATGGTPDPQSEAQRIAIEDAIGRSAATEASRGALRAFAPQPDLLEPQGALRGTLRGAPGELSVTVGTALERLPSLQFSDEFLQAIDGTGPPPTQLSDLLVPPPVTLVHPRFYVASLDAATDLGPVQVGAEVAYMFRRTLTASAAPTTGGPLTSAQVPQPGRSDVAQLALRAELLEGEGFVAVLETFVAFALDPPADPARRWLLLDEGHRMYGVAGGLQWSLGTTGLTLELGGALLNGPTYAAIPRVEWEAVQGLFVELGALAVGGNGASAASPNPSLGALFDGTDQVFTGVRWVP
jgi:hypothetical protein